MLEVWQEIRNSVLKQMALRITHGYDFYYSRRTPDAKTDKLEANRTAYVSQRSCLAEKLFW
jgi:hypothetical protein